MEKQNPEKKYPVDILIEKIDKIFMANGKGPGKIGNKTGSFIYIPPKRKNSSDNSNGNQS